MRTLITGATGFLGEFVARELAQAGRPMAAFVRLTSNTDELARLGIELCPGDLANLQSLKSALSNTDTLVSVASLGFGHAPNIVNAALAAGVQRAVFVSTTSVFTRLPSSSQPVRREAEDLIRASGLNYTLIRPTMIYGTPRDRNIWRLIRYLRRWPAIAVFGDGRRLQQPVYVADLAGAIRRILDTPATIGREYNLPGATQHSFNELIDTVARALGRRMLKIHLPLRLGVGLAHITRLLPAGPRIRPEQIMRLAEDKVYDYAPASADFGYNPLAFNVGIKQELQYLKADSGVR